MDIIPFNTNKGAYFAEEASKLANRLQHEYVTLEHLLCVLLKDPKVVSSLKAIKANVNAIGQDLEQHLAGNLMTKAPPGRTARQTTTLRNVIYKAVAQCMFSGKRELEAVDLLISLVQEKHSHACWYVLSNNATELDLKKHLSHGLDELVDEVAPPVEELSDSEDSYEKAERLLRKYCTLLNERAAEGRIDPLIGREREVEDMILILSRRQKNNPVLVGEPGVGKTSVAEGLAWKIERDEVPDVLLDVQVWSLDIGSLIAGTKFRGDMEERLKHILSAVETISKSTGVVMFIDEIHMIMGAGGGSQNAMDLSNLLKPALSRGELRCIGSTTYDEYRKHFEKDRALARRFQKLDILEPNLSDAKRIVRGAALAYEAFHNVKYSAESVDAAVELSARYISDRVLPDKAIDILDLAGARARVAKHDLDDVTPIDEIMIEREVARLANNTTKNCE